MTSVLGELHLSGLGVIEDAVIEPAPTFTVVTGETGAGKTMIVTALGLICGGRADSDRVRLGARRAVVEARFVPGCWFPADQRSEDAAAAPDRPAGADHPVTEHPGVTRRETGALLAAMAETVGGDTDDDGSLLAVRSVSADGRSRAYIGGRAVPVAALAGLAEPLLTVHGQSEAMSLLRPASARDVLDRYAGLEPALGAYRALREEWLAVRAEIADRSGRARERAQREHVLRVGLEEIDRAGPQPGEDTALAAEVRRLENADALRAVAHEALAALAGTDDTAGGDQPSAVSLVHTAIRLLQSAADPALSARQPDLRGASAVLGDVAADLAGYLDQLGADPGRLTAALERQAVLRGLVRRYGDDVDGVLDWAARARAELTGLDTSEGALESLRERAAELQEEMTGAAVELTTRRRAAADRLGGMASGELKHLAMGSARLRIVVTPRVAAEGDEDCLLIAGQRLAAGPDGPDQVEILLAAHAGAPELPVARGASGGELSRVMLALEVVLAGADPVATLVFDEVDAGVGGRAAIEIGRRLAQLARSHQVIVVTHLAQVAAFAERHFVVDAAADGTVGASSVRLVDGADRRAELARMLGGTDGDVARAHAADLLARAKPQGAQRKAPNKATDKVPARAGVDRAAGSADPPRR